MDNLITQLNPNDVLCGRGSGPNDYSGNIKFRALVMDRRDEYLSTSNRASKAKVAREIVAYVKRMNPPGRFLEQVEQGKTNQPMWRMVSEEKALEKAKQALRQNRHRRGGCGSSGSFVMISPSPSMGSNCERSSPPPRMNGHYRSYSYGGRGPPRHIPNNNSMPYYNPSPPPINRAMSAGHEMHHRSRSDHAFMNYAEHHPHHHRSYSERHYDGQYYRPPPIDYYYPPEHYQHQYTQDNIDRKYFNDYEQPKMESVPDEDSITNEQYDIMPDSVTSVHKRSRNCDISPTNINIFETEDEFSPSRNRMFSVESTDFKPKRNRMFSADSDISAIELELDSNTNTTKVILPPSPTDMFTKDDDSIVVKELIKEESDEDPLCISDIPDESTKDKRSFDVSPNEMLKDFDMSYYVLQTLGDDIHDL